MSTKNKIQKDDIISVPVGNKFIQGQVKEVDDKNIIIDNYVNGNIKVPNNQLAYKFFPGQKFDLREFNSLDANGGSLKTKLDAYLSKTEIGTFKNLQEKHPKQVAQLLAGKLTSNLINGASLVKNAEGTKEIKNWAAKFQIYRGADKSLKLDIKFKQAQLQSKVYGTQLSPEQESLMKEKGQTITVDVTTKTGRNFKVFAKFDKELNSYVTSPYNEAIETRMKAAYAKKEEASKTTSKTKKAETKIKPLIEKPTTTKTKTKGKSI